MISLKPDVMLRRRIADQIPPIVDVKPQTVLAIAVAGSIWQAAGVDLEVTSVLDGKHMLGSFHYKGLAVDLRTNSIQGEGRFAKVQKLRNDLAEALGEDFDVLLEDLGLPNEHVHVEYQPKRPL